MLGSLLSQDTLKKMYPEGCLINPEGNIIVVFEKDLNNPNYEGFIEFWEIINNNKQLTFKKRTNKKKGVSLRRTFIREGWKLIELEKVA